MFQFERVLSQLDELNTLFEEKVKIIPQKIVEITTTEENSKSPSPRRQISQAQSPLKSPETPTE